MLLRIEFGQDLSDRPIVDALEEPVDPVQLHLDESDPVELDFGFLRQLRFGRVHGGDQFVRVLTSNHDVVEL